MPELQQFGTTQIDDGRRAVHDRADRGLFVWRGAALQLVVKIIKTGKRRKNVLF